ncbi:hypothetical protein JTB14_009467 [Gonioctena quinquepunctata]|nr:hypothetical protein JTB14_009467 [Gonioctena quinquepunctata]
MTARRGLTEEELRHLLESEDEEEYLPSELEYSSDSEIEDIGIEEQEIESENEEVNISTPGTRETLLEMLVRSFSGDDNFVPPNMNFDNWNSGISENLKFLKDSPELDYFLHFFYNNLISIITEQTNIFGTSLNLFII